MTRIDISAVRRIHIFADTILVSIGWIGAYWLRFALNDVLGAPINSFDVYFRSLPLVVAPWMFSCWMFGIYRSSRVSTLVEEFQTLFRGVALGLLVVSSISFFFRELYFGRFVVLACVGLNLVLQGISRIVFHKIEDRMRRGQFRAGGGFVAIQRSGDVCRRYRTRHAPRLLHRRGGALARRAAAAPAPASGRRGAS